MSTETESLQVFDTAAKALLSSNSKVIEGCIMPSPYALDTMSSLTDIKTVSPFYIGEIVTNDDRSLSASWRSGNKSVFVEVPSNTERETTLEWAENNELIGHLHNITSKDLEVILLWMNKEK